MWNTEYKLHLYPVDHYLLPPPPFFEKILKSLEFIAEQIPSGNTEGRTRYKVGNQFLSQITFMGCSPDIELEPQENSPYCYIEIEQVEKPQFISGKNLKPAKCPHCKAFITQLSKDLGDKKSCEQCHQAIHPGKLNWRKTAFYASSWITIGNIYELEAIPNDSFLNALEKATSSKWKVAYIRHLEHSNQTQREKV